MKRGSEKVEPQDSLETREKMAEMHDDVLHRIDDAISKKHSIEACWLCYSCFESRISRTLEKVSQRCPYRICYQNHNVGIKTRIDCLKRLNRRNYPFQATFDNKLLDTVYEWCKKRNRLVHALITLNNYYGMDDNFLQLAVSGKRLLKALYEQTTDFRNEYYSLPVLPDFPLYACDKCYLCKRAKEKTLLEGCSEI